MKRQIKFLLRDLLFLVLFLFLVGVLVRRVMRFIAIHKQSLIHELDDILLNQLEMAKKQCIRTINLYKNLLSFEQKDVITSFLKKIDDLEEQYKKNSHGLILLGPIGTISIVLKERKIKANLLEIINTLNQIILKNVNKSEENKKTITSVEDGLDINQRLLF